MHISYVCRQRVLFNGTRFSNLYTAVDTPAEAACIYIRITYVCICTYVCNTYLGRNMYMYI